MKIELRDIIDLFESDIIEIKGNYQKVSIKNLKAPPEIDEFTLDWVNPQKSNKQEIADTTKARVVLVDKEVVYSNKMKEQGKILIYVSDPKLHIAQIANHFFVEKKANGIHASSTIDTEARIGENVYIGPNCIIGKCTIGNNVELHGNNFVYDNVTIKNNVEIHAGAIIGSEAHNFVEDMDGNKIKFPHLGGVIIEDDVIIGAQSVISRGVLSNTIIGKGTKIAQLVIIGANNIIGNNCAIRANVMISGSVKIGNNTKIAPSVTIREKRNVGINCFLGLGAVVTKDVPSNETWIGVPAKKMQK